MGTAPKDFETIRAKENKMKILTGLQRRAIEFIERNKGFMDENKDLFEPPFDQMRYYPRKK